MRRTRPLPPIGRFRALALWLALLCFGFALGALALARALGKGVGAGWKGMRAPGPDLPA